MAISNSVISLTISRDLEIPLVADTVQILASDRYDGYWEEVARCVFRRGARFATVSLPTSALEFVWVDPDVLERFLRLEAEIDEMRIDRDGDGLTDREEDALDTNPLVVDTDGDGLSDRDEFELGTDPLCIDTDGDGVSDGVEVASGTNPLISGLPLPMPTGPHFELIGTNIYTTVCDDPSASAPFIATTAATALSNEVLVAGVSYAEAWAPPYTRVGTGLVFRALHTGYFDFKLLSIDDSAEVCIGPIKLRGQLHGQLTHARGILVAGHDYPIRILARNEGGSARLAFASADDSMPTTNSTFNSSFSTDQIIFEKNASGMTNQTNSTKAVSNLKIRGGECGVCSENLVRLEIKSDFDVPIRISVVSGEILFPSK